MNEKPKENKGIKFGRTIKLFNENFSSLAEIVYKNSILRINFKFDFLKNHPEFKNINKVINIKKDNNQGIANEKEIREWISEWYKLMRRKLDKLKKLVSMEDSGPHKWFMKQVQEKIDQVNTKWKTNKIKKVLSLSKNKKFIMLIDKSGDKPKITKKAFDEKFDWSNFFNQLEKQESTKNITELKEKLHELEIEGIYFGFTMDMNKILLYDKSGEYMENNIDFDTIKSAILYIEEIMKDIRCKKKEIEDKLSILNNGYRQYDYLLTGKNIIITIIKDSEIETKMFSNYDDFWDWYHQEEQNN